MKEAIDNYREKVDKKLVNRQRIFLVIILVLIIIGAINILQGKINIVLAVSGFLLATLVGLLLSRMFKIFWHQEREKIVSQLDAVGGILLALYIGIELGRNWAFGHWLSGPTLTAFGLIILTGLLLGRFLGTLLKINKILSEDTLKDY